MKYINSKNILEKLNNKCTFRNSKNEVKIFQMVWYWSHEYVDQIREIENLEQTLKLKLKLSSDFLQVQNVSLVRYLNLKSIAMLTFIFLFAFIYSRDTDTYINHHDNIVIVIANIYLMLLCIWNYSKRIRYIASFDWHNDFMKLTQLCATICK